MAKLLDEKTLSRSLEFITRYVSPFNAITVFVLTCLDLFGPTLAKGASKALGIVLAALIIMILYRIYSASRLKSETGTSVSTAGMFFRDRTNIMAIGLIPVAIFFFWYNVAHAGAASDGSISNGAISDNVPGVRHIQVSLLGIQNDVTSIKENVVGINLALDPTDVRGKLKVLGYGLDDESKAKAIEACDLEALQLYVAANETLPLATPVMMSRGGSNIEKPIMAKNPRLPKVLDILAAQGVDFNQRYMLTFTQAQTGEIPEFQKLVASVKPTERIGLSPSIIKANALTLTVWSKNEAAYKKLLDLGVSVNVGVDAQLPEIKNGLMTGQMVAKQIASAQSEVLRLTKQ